MFKYLQTKHTESKGDVVGQQLTFNTPDEWLLEYTSQLKNAINNADVMGLSILVTDLHHNAVFQQEWVRYVEPQPEPEPVPPTLEELVANLLMQYSADEIRALLPEESEK